MIQEAKKNLAKIIFEKKYLSDIYNKQLFNSFLEDANKFLFLLPGNDKDFKHAFDVVKYFQIHKKEVSLFLPEYAINLIIDSRKYKFIGYGVNDVNKLGLPSKSLINSLKDLYFDVVVDLNRTENLFFIAVAHLVQAKYRIGFSRKSINAHYNVQLVNKKINSEITYRNLLNSLKMFQ